MASWLGHVSLRRLLLCAAFVAFGLTLASWTSARADDQGLLGVVGNSVPTVGSVLADTTEAIDRTVTAVPLAPVEPVVTKSVAVVTKVTEKPVAGVDSISAVVVTSATKTLSHTTSDVVTAVTTIVPGSDRVVDPVVDVIAPVARAVETLPVTVPEVRDAVVEVLAPLPAVALPPVTSRAPAAAPASATAPAPTPAPLSASPSVMTSGPTVTADGGTRAVRPVVVSPDTVALPVAATVRLDSTAPNGPGAPQGGLVLSGAVPAPTSGGSSGSSPGGADLAITPASLHVPDGSSVAVFARGLSLTPGPALDPGSRPG